MAAEGIEAMLQEVVNFQFDNTFNDSITKIASQYNTDVYTKVNDFVTNCSFGIGASLLSIFLLMEIVAIVQRVDGGGGMGGINIPANMIIRWGIFTFLFCHMNSIMNGIQAVTVTMASKISYTANPITAGDVSTIMATIESMSIFNKLFIYITIYVVWIAFSFLKSIISCFVIFRIFQIWIMIMFAPIPLSTIPSREFRSTAINFLKSFAANCLSGVIILAAFLIFSVLMPSYLNNKITASMTATEVLKVFLTNILYLVALSGVVFNSGRLSKSLLNAI